MAPPNKRNSFMLFVNHWRKDHPQMSVPQAVSHCSGIWEKMTAQERKPFGAAAFNKSKQALAEADQAQRDLAAREQYMRSTTERIVREGKLFQDLENTKFLFCAFNYFTKDPDGDVYVPAEFAACEYSLKEGIISVFSTLIDPGKLNLGLGRDAQEHSMTTHNLPLPPKALGESNLVKLRTQMIRYLSKHHGRRQAIVFTTTDMRPIVQSCLRFLACNGHENFLHKIQVFDIQYLFFVLKKETLNIAGLPNDKINIYITDAFFLKDFFEFTNDIACEFHEENDRTKYCAQSMVMRWAFTFSDYMCGDLDITIVPGKHVPSTVKTNYRIHNANTWSVTLTGGSSVDSFHSLPSFQGLQINETSNSRRLRNNSPITNGSASTMDHDGFEVDETQRGRRQKDFSRDISPISSRFSIACAPYVPTINRRQGGHHRNPSVDSQRRSPKEFLDDISTIYGATDKKYSSRTKSVTYGATDKSELEEVDEYGRKGGRRLVEILEAKSPMSSRRSSESLSFGVTAQRGSSKTKDIQRQGGHQRNPFLDDIFQNNSRSSAFIPYAASTQKASSSTAEEYPRQDEYHRNSSSSQRRSSKEFPGNMSPINNHRSNAYISYGATDQTGSEEDFEYQRQDGRPHKKFSDDISSINSRRSSAFVPYGDMIPKHSSQDKEYSRHGESRRHPSSSQRRSFEKFSKNISPINSLRSSAYIPCESSDQTGSEEDDEYERQSGRRLKEFSDNNSPFNSSRSSAFITHRATDQKISAKIEKYPKRKDRNYSAERDKPVYPRRFVKMLPDQPFDFDD